MERDSEEDGRFSPMEGEVEGEEEGDRARKVSMIWLR